MSKKSKRKNRFITLVLVLLFLVLVRFVTEIGVDQSSDIRFMVVKVIDGDTVVLKGGDKLRLLSIDTPEKDEPFYDKAKLFVSRVALNQIAEIKYADTRRDKYGRLLGYLYIDTLNVNQALLDSGYANIYLFKDNELNNMSTSQLLEAQKRAIKNKLGIWSLKKNKEEFYLRSPGSFRLHRPGCRSLDMEHIDRYQRFDDRLEAFQQGLSPCRNCQP